MEQHVVSTTQWIIVGIVIFVTFIVWAVVIFILIPRLEKLVQKRKNSDIRRRIPGPGERMSSEELNRLIEKMNALDDPPDS